MTDPSARPSATLGALLVAIALLAIVVPAIAVWFAPEVVPVRVPVSAPTPRVVESATLPSIEPVEYQPVAPKDARTINAAIPFTTDPVPPARPFRFGGGADDRARATDCLAAAVFYEAGDDAVGERAVAQVVLNRVRHPAFPQTVCGVVFQGAERATGCQFTFTCDGAMRRTPSEAAWQRAREIATSALGGSVDKNVGYATHYHTDWVVPYWSASLDKVTEIHTHLFFRWSGWWGTPRAFTRQPLGTEAPVMALAALSPAHRFGDTDGTQVALADATPFFGRTAQPLRGDPDTIVTSLNPAQAASFPAMALASCGDRTKCKFMGWTDTETMPFTAALSPQQMAAMSFSYLRDRGSGLERTLWNCAEFKRQNSRECMKRQVLRVAVPVVSASETSPIAPARGPAELGGVRRRQPTDMASPSPADAPPIKSSE